MVAKKHHIAISKRFARRRIDSGVAANRSFIDGGPHCPHDRLSHVLGDRVDEYLDLFIVQLDELLRF